jgi:serine/threonine-protein kinase
MLYEMLTGKTPFTGRSPVAIMNARLTRSLPPLRLTEFALAPQLQEVLCRATEREPRNRYASAHEFGMDLEHLDQVGVAERPELTGKGSATPASRILLFALIALVPIILFVVMLLLSRHR